MQIFVSSTVKSCYFHLRCISQIRKYLTVEATSKLVVSLVLSRIDYCNSLLTDLPESTIHPLSKVQINAARLIFMKKKSDSITPLLNTLHWLPVAERVKYKTLTLCYKSLNNSAPSYLSGCLKIYIPSRTLRFSSDTRLLIIPRAKLSTFGSRAFSVSAPKLWNTLPLLLRQKLSLSSFKSSLKTYLFPLQ